ncbi:hypothetical protein SAMN05216464_113140 [Mucilaginibacter pineti]|uniref:Transcriptional regulator, TetR family n=1 Tax=Mucilaginibacter pineti TaxID=1391627 RepID=A0A1G7IS03_9SPHI|nr:TetR/AcrR family transcriptional regulator [Mucilaginibacter pineti]SDF15451.1 hypothetical protein SAMN05216464_113140 [Mucilaginibacter pineti]
MARRYRKRDKEGSMARMVWAIGEILRTKGHRFLYLNEIARCADVGKQYVKKYFGSVNGLIRAYIMETEYWLPHFEEVKSQPLPAPDNLLDYYISTLQEQFRYFNETPELQKIILWQISEPNALMRSISERREKDGALLLGLSDPHFLNSGISLKAVVAMILGGGYYVAMQAGTNNSPVCGIDVNTERDREIFIETMVQILKWAWKAADENRHKHGLKKNV